MQEKFKVTCLNCNESDIIITVSEGMKSSVVDYEKKFNTPFMSFRWRGDLKWGFFCRCGNDNRLAASEANDFDNIVRGDPMSLKRISESLLVPDEKQFSMVAI